MTVDPHVSRDRLGIVMTEQLGENSRRCLDSELACDVRVTKHMATEMAGIYPGDGSMFDEDMADCR